MKKILILASNPNKDLDLKQEIKDLKKIIQRQAKESGFEVEIELGVRPNELQELLLEHQPSIVHFCGHGTGDQGLVLQNDAARGQLVSTDALCNLFALFKDNVECVVLNACYSEEQAKYIVDYINYVVGMSHEIRDDAAIAFATGFYRALGYGKSVEESYKLGCNAIQLGINDAVTSRSRSYGENRKFELIDRVEPVLFPEHLKPVLKKKEQLTPIDNHKPAGSLDVESDVKQAVQKEIVRKRYRQQSRDTWQNFGTDSATKQPQNKKEYRYQKLLLRKVKEFWIEGILENSLHNKVLIEFKAKDRSDAVQSAFSGVEELPVELDDSFDELEDTAILSQIGTGKTLLILGEPGSGKTITLLTLAQQLITRSEQDLSLPTPVVFNLSSWAIERLTIAEWLVEELQVKYQVSKTLGKTWIEQEQLILLLDGLDEVQEKHRNACVLALNKFIDEHGATEIVVCSRVRDYEALSERLKLRSAICIQPLTAQEVYQYLDKAGEQLAGLKMLLQQDEELEEFAQTPLILSIMSLAYQGYSAKDLSRELESGEETYQHLFNTYIERMLHRKGTTQVYSPNETKRWLIWLAQRMCQNSQTVFLIEGLQPKWLKNRIQRVIYRWLSALIFLLIFFVSKVIIVSISSITNEVDWLTLQIIGLSDTLIVGGIGALIVGLGKEEIETFETINFSWKTARNSFTKGVMFGLVPALIFGLIVGVVVEVLDGQTNLIQELIYIIKAWLIFTVVFGFFTGTIGGLSGLIKGLKGSTIQEKNIPNQGISVSFKLAVYFTIIPVLILILISLPISKIMSSSLIIGLNLGLSYGLIIGFFTGLFGGGKACIRHFTLRLLLHKQGYMPWNYAQFLDYAADRMLVQKVGGGYIFVHRMLLEHFAQMKLD